MIFSNLAMTRKVRKVSFCMVFTMWFISFTSYAIANSIRDAETENAFQILNDRFITHYGFDKNHLKMRLIINDQFNAKVTGVNEMYYMSGLILELKTAEEFMAVSAHELAHIKAGHFNRVGDVLSNSMGLGAIGLGLGVLGGIITQSPSLVFGALGVSSQVSSRGYLQYVRSQEITADYMALSMIDAVGLSPVGQVKVQQLLLDKMGKISIEQGYSQTHPASEDRLEIAKKALEKSPNKAVKLPKIYKDTFLRIQAKLFGYIRSEKQVYSRYPISDTSDHARYARAMNKLASYTPKEAIKDMRALVEKHPNDPYYMESYAQILLKSGNVEQAIWHHKKALEILPNSSLFLITYAESLLKKGTKSSLNEAERVLLKAVQLDNKEPLILRLLVGVYGRQGDDGKRLLARAEEAYLFKKPSAATIAKQALQYLAPDSPEFMRAKDIIELYK